MHCAIAQSDAGPALSIYRKYEDMRSIAMGRQPSADTEQLTSRPGLRTPLQRGAGLCAVAPRRSLSPLAE